MVKAVDFGGRTAMTLCWQDKDDCGWSCWNSLPWLRRPISSQLMSFKNPSAGRTWSHWTQLQPWAHTVAGTSLAPLHAADAWAIMWEIAFGQHEVIQMTHIYDHRAFSFSSLNPPNGALIIFFFLFCVVGVSWWLDGWWKLFKVGSRSSQPPFSPPRDGSLVQTASCLASPLKIIWWHSQHRRR